MSSRYIEHGTETRYATKGCRCAPCKAAHAAYMRQWRAAGGANTRLRVSSRDKALEQLRRNHQLEYADLFAVELAKHGLEPINPPR
jgi:hypothetical protein